MDTRPNGESDGEPLHSILRHAQLGMGADFAVVTLSTGTRQLVVRAVVGADLLPGVAVDASRADGQLFPELGKCISAPLPAGTGMAGLLSVGRLPGGPPFTEADNGDLVRFASHTSAALELDRTRAELAGVQISDHVIGELFDLCMGLQGLVPIQPRPENRARLAGYVHRMDALVRHIRACAASDLVVHRQESLPQRLLTTVEDQSVVLGLPVHVEFTGRLDLAAELSDRVVLVVRSVLRIVAHHPNASSAHLRVAVLGGFVIVEIIDDGRDPDHAAMVTVLAEYRGVLSQSNTRDGGTHLTWTASVH